MQKFQRAIDALLSAQNPPRQPVPADVVFEMPEPLPDAHMPAELRLFEGRQVLVLEFQFPDEQATGVLRLDCNTWRMRITTERTRHPKHIRDELHASPRRRNVDAGSLDHVSIVCKECGTVCPARRAVVATSYSDPNQLLPFCSYEHASHYNQRLRLLRLLVECIADGIVLQHTDPWPCKLDDELYAALGREFAEKTLYLNDAFERRLVAELFHSYQWKLELTTEPGLRPANVLRGPASYYVIRHGHQDKTWRVVVTLARDYPVVTEAVADSGGP